MRAKLLAAGLTALAMVAALTTPSHANWLSRIVREAAETGGGAGAGKIGRLGLGALDDAAAHVATLPRLSKGTPLAAHATPEGHWKFANREGEVFTAATADELARVRTALAPHAAPTERLAIYLSDETVFARRAQLKELPDADLFIVSGRDAYPLKPGSGSDDLVAVFRPGVTVPLVDRTLFGETVYRLARPLSRANIRVLALQPGGPARLSSVPRYDPATKAALVDSVDPAALPAALSSLRGQTALVTGRLDGNRLVFSSSGNSVDVTDLVKAAEAADVNLIVIQAGAAHQPGGRNWFWQRIAVAGLDDAMKRATFADFLNALGGDLVVRAAPGSQGRVTLSAIPIPNAASPITGTLSDWLGEVTGHVIVKSAEIYARDADRQRELDARIVPGVPSAVQYSYLGFFVIGLLGLGVARGWWARIWPPEQRSEYRGRLGYWAARTVRSIAFVVLFLPLVGLPAFLWSMVLYTWKLITAPVRGLGWLRQRLSPRRA